MGKSIQVLRLVLISTLMALGSAGTVYAHQPYLVNDTGVTRVDKPEVSKAFYARLLGEPAVYEIVSPDSFALYVNILVPDEVGIPTDLSVTVTRGPDTIAVLEGPAYKWTKFYESFGGDSYLMGPELRLRAGPGTHIATVSRPGDEGRYVLAVGEREEFSLGDMVRTIGLMPRLKRDFFHKASIRAFTDPLGSLFRRKE
jgi:catechol 2,3-dioxygenase-like lactoylglutathione lyase family enzyme